EAYAFLRLTANLNDPDERLRLARWCDSQRMKKEALEEVAAAVQLRPKHAPSRRWLQQLQQANAETLPPCPPTVADNEAKSMAQPTAEVSAECLGQFTTRVQPILMNACASCHAGDRGGEFKLTRVNQPGAMQRRSSQKNLAAVMAQINLAKPE